MSGAAEPHGDSDDGGYNSDDDFGYGGYDSDDAFAMALQNRLNMHMEDDGCDMDMEEELAMYAENSHLPEHMVTLRGGGYGGEYDRERADWSI
ncbi:hypothetical protein K432DRAFT_407868 [Lepidopterella palustris CBS 459.81]|uniref:Uncharacterized protein n=1 Tax=Lepidopterella palustris CBS 459.81 TaxID=1314670 RepID=A0A8E2JBZ2_9PEZI|nr:hypothetical protein K432DRAFT_407868 [Lepidopterella palustris CBS 459.81]